ncbi:hypothetical protein P43SY_001665 [Pythium insidiosum]|uniref:RPA-interacting protein N-terminal domain-containing protein n=1 Tax=Pythium insidiosum TaxID=114742 RepID=A0AAD5LZD4_PYTIN|nr:hypothetical protein P43SY_001665 [Pythium insidiosum]
MMMRPQEKHRTSVTKSAAFHASLSPPLWKDQLRQRCVARVKENRHALLARLRSPDPGARTSIADEMKRIVYREERRATTRRHPVFDFQRDEESEGTEPIDDLLTIDDLVNTGKLSEDDYLDIMHSLEEALRDESRDDNEDEVLLAQEMVDFEEASLMAMLNGLDLDGVADFDQSTGDCDVVDEFGVHVLCPMCKTRYLQCSAGREASELTCKCSFTFVVKV